MLKEKLSPSPALQLCSRCLSHEIESWMNEKWAELNEDAKKSVVEELRTIKLTQGNCIVCNNSIISDGTIGRIRIILNDKSVPEKTQREFKKLFCII